MNRIFDSSSLINLANGALLDPILSLSSLPPQIGPQVRGECTSIGSILDDRINSGAIVMLDDDDLPVSLFARLRMTYALGPGETECLAFAMLGNQIVCCDDSAARAMMTNEIGATRVTGSLGLVIEAIRGGLMGLEDAYASYQQMRRCGGYLPNWSLAQMAKAVDQLRPFPKGT